MRVLRDVAASGCAVVMSLHQPTSRVYRSLDKVIALSQGGHLMYCGPPMEVVSAVVALHTPDTPGAPAGAPAGTPAVALAASGVVGAATTSAPSHVAPSERTTGPTLGDAGDTESTASPAHDPVQPVAATVQSLVGVFILPVWCRPRVRLCRHL